MYSSVELMSQTFNELINEIRLTNFLSMELGIDRVLTTGLQLTLKLIVHDKDKELTLPTSTTLNVQRRSAERVILHKLKTIQITLKPCKNFTSIQDILSEVLRHVLPRGCRPENICIPCPLFDAAMLNKSIPGRTRWLSLHLCTLSKFTHFSKLSKIKHLGIYILNSAVDLKCYANNKLLVERYWLIDLKAVMIKVATHMKRLRSLRISGFYVPDVLKILQACFGSKIKNISLNIQHPARNDIVALRPDEVGQFVEDSIEKLCISGNYIVFRFVACHERTLNLDTVFQHAFFVETEESLTSWMRNSSRWSSFSFPKLKALSARYLRRRGDELLHTIITLFNSIQQIYLSVCGRFSSNGVAEIFKHCTNLTLFYMYKVEFDCQRWVFDSIPTSLRILHFMECVDVSEECVVYIRDRYPSLKVLDSFPEAHN